MDNKKIDKKILKIKKKIDCFISDSDYLEDDIHKIRICAREILSLLKDKNLNCIEIKKILKLSNKIRDIDVLLNQYLVNIPKKHQIQINLSMLNNILTKKRDDDMKILLNYLKQFLVENIVLLKLNKTNFSISKPELSSNIKQLHKYRIYIKNLLYITKNETSKDKFKIKLLTKIKNLLGDINDNYNAIKIIKKISSNKINLDGLINYTNKKNNSSFNKAKKLILTL